MSGKHFSIQISADLSNLTKALRSANSDLKSGQLEISKFQKALRNLDGSKFKALEAQSGRVKESLKILEDKLTLLKQAEDKFVKENGVDTKNQAFRKLQLEIVQTEKAIQELTQKQKEFSATNAGIEQVKAKQRELTAEMKKSNEELKELRKLSSDSKGIANIQARKELYKALQVTIGQTKEKLALLKEQSELVFKNRSNLAEGEKQFKKIQSEIKKTTIELKNLKKESKANTGLKALGDQLGVVKGKLNNLSQKTQGASIVAGLGLGASVKSFVDFEKAMVGVKKTVDPTNEEFKKLTDTAMKMSTELPNSAVEIANLMKTAGQLGISKPAIADFTRTIIDLSNSTNILGEEGAEKMAKFANVTGMAEGDYRRFGSSIVRLGNNFATTEADILEMSTRLGGAGKMAGLTVPQILGLSTAMSSVGISAEEGGSAMTKVLNYMQVAVVDTSKKGQEHLQKLAEVTGLSTKQFKEKMKTNAMGALQDLVTGFQKIDKSGGSVIQTLQEMGINNIREQQTLTKLATSGDQLAKSIDTSTKAWEDNNDLTKESSQYYETTEAKMLRLKNQFQAVAIQLGEKLKPALDGLITLFSGVASAVSHMSPTWTSLIAGGLAVVTMLSGMFKGLGIIVGGFQAGINAVNTMKVALQGLSVSTPWMAGLTALIVGAVAVWAHLNDEAEKTKKKNKEISDQFNESYRKVAEAERNAKSEFQEYQALYEGKNKALQDNRNKQEKIQSEITAIITEARLKKRDLYQKEIKDIEEKLKRLEELKAQEVTMTRVTSDAIATIAKKDIEGYQGDLNGLNQLLQDKTKSLNDSQETELNKLRELHEQKIGILNQKYATEEARNSEAYKKELDDLTNSYADQKNKTIEHYDGLRVDLINATEQRKDILDQGIINQEKINKRTEELMGEQGTTMKRAIDSGALSLETRNLVQKNLDELRNKKSKQAWKEYVENMSQAERDQLFTQMNMISNKVKNGGQLNDEDKKIVEKMTKVYEHLPEDQRKVMEQTMEGMKQGVQNKKKSLFDVFGGVATSLTKTFPKIFEIRSPSRVTRRQGAYILQGIQRGLLDEADKTVDTLDKITGRLNTRFASGLDDRLFNLDPTFVETTKMVFTTPNITFNVKQMSDEELDRATNYINRKLGGAY